MVSSGLALTGQHGSCAEDPRVGCSAPGGLSQEQRGRIPSLDLLAMVPWKTVSEGFFLSAPGQGWLSELAHVQLFIHENPQVLLHSSSQWVLLTVPCHKNASLCKT